MLSTSAQAANERETGPTKAVEQKEASSTYQKTSEAATGIDEKATKETGSKTDKVKGWAKSARQWTIFGDSTNPEQERAMFYR